MKLSNNFYVYFHRNPTTNEIFYVGMGRLNRCYSFHGRSSAWFVYVAANGQPIVEIVEDGLTKEEACTRERFYIKSLGKFIDGEGALINFNQGGDGGPVLYDDYDAKNNQPTPIRLTYLKPYLELAAKEEGISLHALIKRICLEYCEKQLGRKILNPKHS